MARWQLRSRRLPQSASWQRHRRRRHKARPGQVAGIHARGATAHVRRHSGAAPRDRRPSVSGGYGRPTASMPSRSGSSWSLPRSASDQALARQSSREALETFRQRSQPEVYSRRPSVGSSGPWDGPRRRDPVWETRAAREDWYGRSGWSPPSSAGRTLPQFGMWDAMFVWYLLNTLSQPGHADFFHHHATDPGYTAWRAEADRLAAADPSVRQKLAELDTRVAAMQEKPRSTDYLPPDTPPTIALAADREADDSGWGLGFILFLVLVGVVVWFAWRRLSAGRRAQRGRRSKRPAFWYVLSAGLVPRWHDVPRRSCTVHSGGEHDACAGARGSHGQRSDQR